MREKVKIEILKFEVLSEDSDGFLLSGFSAVQSHISGGTAATNQCTTNNCNGGNCVKGCGACG